MLQARCTLHMQCAVDSFKNIFKPHQKSRARRAAALASRHGFNLHCIHWQKLNSCRCHRTGGGDGSLRSLLLNHNYYSPACVFCLQQAYRSTKLSVGAICFISSEMQFASALENGCDACGPDAYAECFDLLRSIYINDHQQTQFVSIGEAKFVSIGSNLPNTDF